MLISKPFVMAAALLALAAIPAFGQSSIGFTVLDELSPDEVAEDTTIYINGQRLGSFHLTQEHRAESIAAEIPAADGYEYVMCGTATTEAQGVRQEHRVNDSGKIADPEGRQFSAYTKDYRAFFLVDTTPGRVPTTVTIHTGPRCIGPIASAD
jgi:hypothetical protein